MWLKHGLLSLCLFGSAFSLTACLSSGDDSASSTLDPVLATKDLATTTDVFDFSPYLNDLDTNLFGVVFDSHGDIYVTDRMGARVYKLDVASGIVTPFAGSGTKGTSDGVGINADLSWVTALTIDENDNLFVAEDLHAPTYHQRIRKIAPDGTVTLLATLPAPAEVVVGLKLNSAGDVIVGTNKQIYSISQAGTVSVIAGQPYVQGVPSIHQDGVGTNAKFMNNFSFTMDENDNVYVCDYQSVVNQYNETTMAAPIIVKVTPAGVVTTIFDGTIGSEPLKGFSARSMNYRDGKLIVALNDMYDVAGLVVTLDLTDYSIEKIVSNTFLAHLGGGEVIALDGSGNAYYSTKQTLMKIIE